MLKSKKNIISLVMLYIGKLSSILTAIVFLPLYHQYLGDENFGILAVVLSLQSLLSMMDFGFSTLITRSVAVNIKNPLESLVQVRNAEYSITVIYSTIFLLAIIFPINSIFHKEKLIVLTSIALFGATINQNLYYNAIIANEQHGAGSLIQTLFGLIKAFFSILAAAYTSSIVIFLVVQLFCTLTHYAFTRIYFDVKQKKFCTPPTFFNSVSNKQAINLLKESKSLAFASFAGAAILYLDKPIISIFMSAKEVSPYFLAVTFCFGSISVVAAPLSQFFQPKLIRAVNKFSKIEKENQASILNISKNFTYVLSIATIAPTLILWLNRDFVLSFWIKNPNSIPIVGKYVSILLPGTCIGLLGFIPYGLLLAVKDFRFQAKLAIILAFSTLTLTAYFSKSYDLVSVCYTYSIYNIISTFTLWIRALSIPSIRRASIKSLTISTFFVVFLFFTITIHLTQNSE